jgi:hypothetical protein
MVNLKFKIFNVKYDFTWYFHVAVHKNYNCDIPFCSINCAFTHLDDDEQGETTLDLLDYYFGEHL